MATKKLDTDTAGSTDVTSSAPDPEFAYWFLVMALRLQMIGQAHYDQAMAELRKS